MYLYGEAQNPASEICQVLAHEKAILRQRGLSAFACYAGTSGLDRWYERVIGLRMMNTSIDISQ